MKRILSIIAVTLVCVCFASCTNKEAPSNTDATIAHTLPPTENVSTEYEWAEIDCELAINDKDGNAVLYAEDFTTFAVAGSTDEDSYIIIKVTDEATDMINTIGTSDLSLTINDEVCDDVCFPEEFTGEFEIGKAMTYEQVCELATTIRGLFN